MQGKSIRKFHKVQALVDGGMSPNKALKKHNLAWGTYIKGKKMNLPKPPKNTAGKVRAGGKGPKFVDIFHTQPANDSVAVVVCSVSNLKKVLGELK